MKNTSDWKERIPKIAIGNAFESLKHFYCKVGCCLTLQTEEEYQRAKQIVVCYPGNYRLLRYEGDGYVPTLYEINGPVSISQYVRDGEGTIPASPESFDAILARFRFVGDDPTDHRKVWAWLQALDDEGLNKLWDAFDTPIDQEERIDEQFFTWPKGTDRYDIWRWFDEQFSEGLAKGVDMENTPQEL